VGEARTADVVTLESTPAEVLMVTVPHAVPAVTRIKELSLGTRRER
jgi:hypothetical protein